MTHNSRRSMDDAELHDLFSFRNEYRSLQYDLANTKVLCAHLGDPQLTFRSALIAGTNGKGSVAWWLSGMIAGSGLYVSPHLEDLNERISIGGQEIDDHDLRAVMREVNDAVERAMPRLLYPPTYFERVTAMAFCYFRNRTRYAVLEVGLGGRLDATNVVSQDVSVITNIGLDHQEHLGPTLGDIAAEKAGIIKHHEPVVLGPRCDYEVIRERAGDRLVETASLDPDIRELDSGFFEFDLQTPVRRYERVRPGLAGRHQVDNAVLAIRSAEALEAAGWPVDPPAILASLARSDWPGRLERIPGDPPVLLDGAHNPDAAREVARYLERCHPQGICLVFGVMRGKAPLAMIEALLPHATAVIFTEARNDRAVSAQDLMPLAAGALAAPHLDEALTLAKGYVRPGQAILVTGSLFLVGEARALLVAEAPGAASRRPSR